MEGPFRALFTTGNTGTDKVKTFGRQFTVTTDGVTEEGVATINDDVTFVEIRLQESIALSVPAPAFTINRIRRGVSRGFNKLLYCVVGNQFLAGFSAITSSVFSRGSLKTETV